MLIHADANTKGSNMQIHQETEQTPGPDVVINCLACRQRGVNATTYDQRIQERLYGVLRVNDVRSTCVVCTGCHTVLRSRVTAAELEGKTAEDLDGLLYLDAGFLAKALAIIALLAAIIPVAGTLMAAIAWLVSRKSPTWPRTVSIVALGLSFVPLVLLGVGIVLAQLGVIK